MAYNYDKKKRTIIVGSNPGEKYVATMALEGKKFAEDLVKHIERNSSTAREDIKILLRDLAVVLEETITSGQGVNLEGLGTFLPNFRTKSAATADDVTVGNIRKVTVNFRPCVEFREEMREAEVKESAQNKVKHVQQ